MEPKSSRISLIAALGARTLAIGKDGDLIWRLPKDLQRFKMLTSGHPVIMGRKTWQSLPEAFRPLPNRTNIVVSRSPDFEAPGAVVTTSIEKALTEAQNYAGSDEIFVIGGGDLYRHSLPFADYLYLTLIDEEPNLTCGDVFFPEFNSEFEIVENVPGKESNISYTWAKLKRK